MVLIDMDRLRKELMAKGDIPIYEVFNTIWDQPIVNVPQPKVGKWTCTDDIDEYYGKLSRCSVCGGKVLEADRYCPYCGSYNGGGEE